MIVKKIYHIFSSQNIIFVSYSDFDILFLKMIMIFLVIKISYLYIKQLKK